MQLQMQQAVVDYKKVIRTRELDFNQEFTREYCVSIAKAMGKLMEYDRIMKTPKDELKLKINIYSYGGAVDSLFIVLSKIDKLKEAGYEVITHNTTVAMSCGFVLSIYGTVKTCTKYATYLNHQLSAGTIGTYAEMETSVEYFKDTQEKLFSIIMENTHFTEEELNKPYATNRDVIYDACSAVKWGIADFIVTD